jgi:O-antigen/teichoic acid export membrane protein
MAAVTETVEAQGPSVVVPRTRLSGVVAGLTVANVLGAASGFITGPLLARALGPTGRGDLAAITVPLVLAPGVLSLGIPAFAYRTLPRGRPIGQVLGSLGLPLILIGLVVAANAATLADGLADGRADVRTWLIVVFAATPLICFGSLLASSLAALSRWRNVVATNLIPFVVPMLGIAVLYIAGSLTVWTAAAVTVAGALLCLVPGLPLLAEGRPVFRARLAREGIAFGLKSWLGGLARIANGRLDQFLMITAVAPRVLGLYAVAVTLAGASGLVGGALAPPLMARIGAGERHLTPNAVRILVGGTLCLNVILALAAPLLLSVLFGHEFEAAYPMAIILLAAQVPLNGAGILSSALQADGAPVIPSIAEAIGLVITVVGLALFLQRFGGVGAACVSLASYGATFLFELVFASRRLRIPLREFVVPTRADATWARHRLVDVLRAVAGRFRSLPSD